MIALKAAALILLAPLALAGCRVETHNNGGKENVDIATPFAGLSVKTNDASIQQGVGLSVYPGATLQQKTNGDDGAADVNLSFGGFHLGVKALDYRTPDAPDKVLAFYRKDMAHFGDVLECRDNKPVGTLTRTREGLTCDRDQSGKVQISHEGDELRAGSVHHQHIVGVERKDGGTKIGLVMLDLPTGLSDDKSN